MNEQQSTSTHAGSNLTEMWLKGTGAIYDMQADSLRNLLRIQAQNAAMFGAPDMSSLFESIEGRAKRLFTSSAEQMSKYARQATEIAELQFQIGRTFVEQAAAAAENMRTGIEQVGRNSEQELEQVRKMTSETRSELQTMQQSRRSQQQQAQESQNGNKNNP